VVVSSIEQAEIAIRAASAIRGGKSWMLVPAVDNTVPEQWLSLLEALDPDSIRITEDVDRGPLSAIKDTHVSNYRNVDDLLGGDLVHQGLASRSATDLQQMILVDGSDQAVPDTVLRLQPLARFGVAPTNLPQNVFRFHGTPPYQLHDLVRVAKSDAATLADWLLRPISARLPMDGRGGGVFWPPISLTDIGIWADGPSDPPHERDDDLSLATFLVVVGESIADMCLFWTLRANRPMFVFPFWLTEAQLADADVRQELLQAFRMESARGVLGNGDNRTSLHLISTSIDTSQLVTELSRELGIPARGWPSDAWPRFFDRRIRSSFVKRQHLLHFDSGATSLLLADHELPLNRPYSVDIEVEIDGFGVPKGEYFGAILGTAHWTTRSGAFRFFVNQLGGPQTSTELNLRLHPLAEIIEKPLRSLGYEIRQDRKAANTLGLTRLLGGDRHSVAVLSCAPLVEMMRKMSHRQSFEGRQEGRYVGRVASQFSEMKGDLPGVSTNQLNKIVQWLLHRRLLFRGLNLRCRSCGTEVWYPLEEIGNSFVCVGCREPHSFAWDTTTSNWRYQVNEQMAHAIDQGIIPQIIAAEEFDRGFVGDPPSAFLMPNLILSGQADGLPNIELDLFGFSRGRWLLCECKTGNEDASEQVRKHRELANAIGDCDVVLVSGVADDSEIEGVDLRLFWDGNRQREPVTLDSAVGAIERSLRGIEY